MFKSVTKSALNLISSRHEGEPRKLIRTGVSFASCRCTRQYCSKSAGGGLPAKDHTSRSTLMSLEYCRRSHYGNLISAAAAGNLACFALSNDYCQSVTVK